MRNSLSNFAIGLFVIAAIVAINNIVGIILFYTSNDPASSFRYIQHSLMMNPFGNWLLALFLLACGALTQTVSDYHAYLYESKAPRISQSLVFGLAVVLLLVSVGEFIFRFIAEIMAHGRLALESMPQAENGTLQSSNPTLLSMVFPYNLNGYARSIGHLLLALLLFDVARRIAQLRLAADNSADMPEGATNA